MSQVHDNIILSYQVDFKNERLILKTQYYRNDGACENTNIIFNNYFTHLFNRMIKGSVIFDVEECPLSFFLEREQKLFEDHKGYGWPILYKTDNIQTELTEFIRKNSYKVFDIDPSYGLYGWVLAKQMEMEIAVSE